MTITLATITAFLAAGTVGAAVSGSGDALWVPGGMFLTGCELLRRAAIAFKEARQIDVDGARKRETEAETELVELRKQRDDIKADRDEQIESLRSEVADLRREVAELKGAHRTTLRDIEERHANEMSAAQRRTEREIRVAYQLRLLVAEHGLTIPDDLLSDDHGLHDPKGTP